MNQYEEEVKEQRNPIGYYVLTQEGILDRKLNTKDVCLRNKISPRKRKMILKLLAAGEIKKLEAEEVFSFNKAEMARIIYSKESKFDWGLAAYCAFLLLCLVSLSVIIVGFNLKV